MDRDIYVYSGVQPGKKGTGNFLSFFLQKFQENNINFKLISYKTPNTGLTGKILKKIGLIKIVRSIYFILVRTSSKTNITKSIVFIFHPQTIGLNITADLITNNKVYIYVLDTFFFCKKSYNYIDGNNACLKCISNPKASKENKCKFLLSNQIDEDYYNFQKAIQQNLESICFLTQNDNQTLLLKQKFGNTINAIKLGMLINLDDDIPSINNNLLKYDFVFHNTNLDAKGIFYFLGLAELMPNLKFLIPYKRNEISSLNNFSSIKNVDFISMSWETGLKSAIVNAKIVINPSLWSSPVEGALLKSIKFNGCVAIVPVDFSFQKEIPKDVVVHLNESLDSSVITLVNLLNSKNLIEKYKQNSSKWLNNYQQSTINNFKKFFKESFTL